MKLTLRARAFGKKFTLITTAYVLAVSSLTASVPFILSSDASAATTVNSQAELVAAISGSDSEIVLGSSFPVYSQVNINRTLTLNGAGYTISPAFSGSGSNDTALAVVAGSPVITNLTVEGTGATNVQGIQVWKSAASLTNVTSRNNDKAGIHVNGSNVTITNATTSGNGGNFGGILVSGGSVTVNGQSRHTENTNWTGNKMDLYRTGGTVNDTNAQYDLKLDFLGQRIYTLKPAPAAPVISTPVQNTKVTNSTGSVSITWGAVSYASSYEVSIDGSAWVAVSSTTYTTTLVEGAHNVVVRSVAKSGLFGSQSAVRNFLVGIPPVFAINNLTNGQRVGTAASGNLNVQGTFTDQSGGYVELQLVKAGVGSVGLVTKHAPVVDGTLADFSTAGLGEGDYTLYSRPTDYLGNALPQQSVTFYLDPTAPAQVTNLSWGNEDGSVASGAFTKREQGTASWSASGDTDVDHYVYKYWNNISTSDHNGKDRAWTTSVGGTSLPGVFNQGSGTHYFTITAVDRAGNESEESAPFEVRFDNQGPSYSISNLSNGDLVGTASSKKLTVVGSFNDNDGGSGANYIQLQLVKDGVSRGISTVHGAVNNGVLAEFDVTGFESGTYQVNVIGAADALGNWAAGPGLSLTIEIDNEEPVATVNSASYLTTATAQTVTGTVSAGSTVALFVDDVQVADGIVPESDGTWSYTFETLRTLGTYELSVVATDASGNQSVAWSGARANLVILEPFVAPVGDPNPSPTPPADDSANDDDQNDGSLNGGFPLASFGTAQQVLGDSTDNTDDDAEVQGISTANTLAAAVDNTDGKAFGLAWYWWLLIIAAVAGAIWWIVGAVRARQTE